MLKKTYTKLNAYYAKVIDAVYYLLNIIGIRKIIVVPKRLGSGKIDDGSLILYPLYRSL